MPKDRAPTSSYKDCATTRRPVCLPLCCAAFAASMFAATYWQLLADRRSYRVINRERVMVLGLSLSTFTLGTSSSACAAIASGLIVLFGLLGSNR